MLFNTSPNDAYLAGAGSRRRRRTELISNSGVPMLIGALNVNELPVQRSTVDYGPTQNRDYLAPEQLMAFEDGGFRRHDVDDAQEVTGANRAALSDDLVGHMDRVAG